MQSERIYKMAFSTVYPLLVQKAERKGRSKAEVDAVIYWLTGYDEKGLQRQIADNVNYQTFFGEAPHINPAAESITGVICGYRVEAIEDKLVQQVRWLDKLIDELAKGRPLEKILRVKA